MQPPDSIPLLQFHYRTFIARTDRSAPVLHIGTLASWLQPLVLLPLHWSDWFLQFRLKACVSFTPPLRRSPPTQYSGLRQALPRGSTHLWFWRHLDPNDASSEGLLSLVSLTHTCASIPCTFPPMLTTMALNHSRLGWFDTHSWKSVPMGLPSSFSQLPCDSRSSLLSSHVSAAHSGTRSSIAYSVILPRLGAPGRWQVALLWSSPSRQRQPKPASKLRARLIRAITKKASRSARQRWSRST